MALSFPFGFLFLEPGGIPSEVLLHFVAACAFGEEARTIALRSEIERLKHGIGSDRLMGNVALALEDTEVLAVHDYEATPSTGEDIMAFSREAISLVSLAHRLTETEIGEKLTKDVHIQFTFSL